MWRIGLIEAIVIGIWVMVLVTGCDVYRTNEGLGVIGPNGGYFWCFDNEQC
jgi:hypothetical protein